MKPRVQCIRKEKYWYHKRLGNKADLCTDRQSPDPLLSFSDVRSGRLMKGRVITELASSLNQPIVRGGRKKLKGWRRCGISPNWAPLKSSVEKE
ncbi:hypothetical protein Pcinc_018590 [Petrolisthes cinctipes]|uniref:Uncharacterized protein n=1 Tax=Petrolisthes cinctipes TaxID=88211 RepID=A0AAE1BHY2_PETCI|nr:hypothetical protein Pcinc_042185 [Petrolisthes cinctipes]KAK3876642.1 hypothetical protein Pcinc_018590 [Petrolisthes cinctipes]